MKHISIGLLLVFCAGCALTPAHRASAPFYTETIDLYDIKTENTFRAKIRDRDYKDLTLLIVLSPRPLKSGFDLQNCGEINDETGKPLEASRRNLCDYHLVFLSSIARTRLEFSPYRFDKPINEDEKRNIAKKNTVGVLYIKRTNSAVLAGYNDRHDVFERIETWFLPFIKGLRCNWAGIDVEQWAKPDANITPGRTGLANIDMSKGTTLIDSSLVAGYTFSDNYRYNILDHLPGLVLTSQ